MQTDLLSTQAPAEEAHRSACEARDWLRRGYTSAALVDELMERIAKRRGQQAATELREEMRRQWKQRATWIGAIV